jgi:hypothetical protein
MESLVGALRYDPEGVRTGADQQRVRSGASLKFATAKLERATARATSDRTQGRERRRNGGDFNDPPPF